LFSLTGEHCRSSKLPLSFRDSLIGERGVLRRELPRLENILSPSAGLTGDVGEVGDRGERDLRSEQEIGEREGGRQGDDGEEGECGKRSSSLGLLSILIVGGATSADLDLLLPSGDGDRDLRDRRDPKPPLFERGI